MNESEETATRAISAAALPGPLASLYGRIAAFSIDQLLLLAVTYPLWLAFPAPPDEEAQQLRELLASGPAPLDPAFVETLQKLEEFSRGPGPFAIVLSFLIAWLYFAWFESRARGATPGKMLCHLQVATPDGQALPFPRAGARAVVKACAILPNGVGLLAGLSFLIASVTPKKQALHDWLAQSIVIRPDKKAKR